MNCILLWNVFTIVQLTALLRETVEEANTIIHSVVYKQKGKKDINLQDKSVESDMSFIFKKFITKVVERM